MQHVAAQQAAPADCGDYDGVCRLVCGDVVEFFCIGPEYTFLCIVGNGRFQQCNVQSFAFVAGALRIVYGWFPAGQAAQCPVAG